MADLAIKAALEAAGADLAVRWHANMEFREAAAIAVAAFLRAAPIHSIGRHMLDGYRESRGPHAREDFAAAVEEAASDG